MPTRRLVCLLLALSLAGCRSDPKIDADALTAARDPRLSTPQRAAAVERAWQDAQAGRTNRTAVRGDLKDVAWSVDLPPPVRLAALRAVIEDQDPALEPDSRSMLRLMLPREPAPEVTAYLADQARLKGWTDATPALVRSLSRPRAGERIDARPEHRALAALHPDRSVTELVYDVFRNPPDAKTLAVVTPDRVRADAWDLLARLDPTGQARAALLSSPDAATDPSLELMRTAQRDLRVLPLTGDEYLWLVSLASPTSRASRAWWAETAAVVAQLDAGRVGKLQLRHLEPIRLAARLTPDRLARSRDELLSQVEIRLADRPVRTRARGVRDAGAPTPERLAAWRDRLSWGDLVTILAIDDALRDPAVRASLLAQRDLDQADTRAEYGGLLRGDAPGDRPFAAVLYPPREGERAGDREFVAPPDMLEQGDLALAHYHFHAQSIQNAEYASPSPPDFAYAARFGRTCLVITSIASTTLSADYLQPDGVVLDLGDVRAPAR